jgi:hypothetical protein
VCESDTTNAITRPERHGANGSTRRRYPTKKLRSVVPFDNICLTESPSPSQEEPASPMLDVHHVHAPIRHWREFFIQIATIVVGLCIAVGIQQTVELLHNHSQRAELRRALRLERRENHAVFTENAAAWRWGTAELQNNLLVFQYLQQHPGTPQEKLPGTLLWNTSNYVFDSAAWDAAHQSSLVSLLPPEEIQANGSLYLILKNMNDVQSAAARAIIEAERYDLSDADPSHLSPAQIETEIQLTQAALTTTYLRGIDLLNLQAAFPDFPATLTSKELRQIRHAAQQSTSELLSPARALTMERLKAAGYIESKPAPEKK